MVKYEVVVAVAPSCNIDVGPRMVDVHYVVCDHIGILLLCWLLLVIVVSVVSVHVDVASLLGRRLLLWFWLRLRSLIFREVNVVTIDDKSLNLLGKHRKSLVFGACLVDRVVELDVLRVDYHRV